FQAWLKPFAMRLVAALAYPFVSNERTDALVPHLALCVIGEYPQQHGFPVLVGEIHSGEVASGNAKLLLDVSYSLLHCVVCKAFGVDGVCSVGHSVSFPLCLSVACGWRRSSSSISVLKWLLACSRIRCESKPL